MRTIIVPAGLALLLAACATKSPSQVAAPTFPTVSERAEVAAEPPPPAMAASGDHIQVWQLRSALNVAALACSRAGETAISNRYNAMLKQHGTLFTQAYLAEEGRYRARHGARWQTIQDQEATRLYNRYANHPEPARFCKEAGSISVDALRVTSADFPRFAAAALPRLETPGLFAEPAPKPAAPLTAARKATKKG
ncbi:hypothetical protein [Polymorphobacter sp.]|uniref:hypothetical protein n=1 Tax=Polymorphobacter sp. TaxID=1909290 RepID=UPI003F72CE39